MQMVISMMGSGRMIKLMVWVITCMLMELHIMVNGRMISNMAKELRLGLMGQDMRAHILKERSMEKVPFVLLMGVCIQGTFSLMKYQAGVNMCGLMENHTKVNGKRIKCMAMEFLLGKMGRGTKVIL